MCCFSTTKQSRKPKALVPFRPTASILMAMQKPGVALLARSIEKAAVFAFKEYSKEGEDAYQPLCSQGLVAKWQRLSLQLYANRTNSHGNRRRLVVSKSSLTGLKGGLVAAGKLYLDAFQQQRSISCLEKFLEFKLIAGVHGRGKNAWIDACGDKMRAD